MTLRQRIAASYARSAWFRLALTLAAVGVSWVGIALAALTMPPTWWAGVAVLAWICCVAIAFSFLAIGPYEPYER